MGKDTRFLARNAETWVYPQTEASLRGGFSIFFGDLRFFPRLKGTRYEKLFKMRERGTAMEDEKFAECVEKYADSVYRVAFHSCKNAADSEDVVQNVFLKLYRGKTEFESEEHLRRWILRVAVNESKKLVCSAWFRKSAPLEEFAGTVDFQAPEESELFLAVMDLPKKYRVPVYLFYYEDYPIKEVAAMCGLKESTVQTRLQRARERLKKKLTQKESGGNTE